MSFFPAIIEGVTLSREVAPVERVWWTAGADIDGDGANGQSGGVACYRPDNKGLDYTLNAYDPAGTNLADRWPGLVVVDGQRILQGPMDPDPGAYISTTAYQIAGYDVTDYRRYLDSLAIRFICIPPQVREFTSGIAMGCRAVLTIAGLPPVECMVGDVEPRNKIAEISMAAALALNLPYSPRNGGTSEAKITYQVFPGQVSYTGLPLLAA